MPTTIFTPQMLRNGTRAVPEIPAGGGGGFTNTYSLDFDGVDDYVQTSGVYSELDGLTNTAFSFWMKTSNTAGVRIVLSIGTPSGDFRACQFQIWSINGAIAIYYNGLSYNSYSNASVISNNVWTHVLITRDSSRAIGDKVRIYINGVDETSSDGTRYLGTAAAADTGLFIGEHPNAYSSPFLGNIDEVAIYNQDMAAYISEIYSVDGAVDLNNLDTAPQPIDWYRNGDNGAWKSPQWLIPNNENKDKVSNYSFDFDGVDDYVDCGVISTLQSASEFTMSCWLNSSNVTQRQGVLKWYWGTNNWLELSITPTSQLQMVIANGAITSGVSTSSIVLSDTWYNVVIIYNGSGATNADRLKIYLNGTDLSLTFTGTIPTTTGTLNGSTFRIGQRYINSDYFLGNIDEASIFNSALTASDVTDIYNLGSPTDLSLLATPPTNWYRMGEEATFSGGVWTVPDAVGSNNGTSNAMTIEDRVGEAPNSENNALSFNMDEVDRLEDVPS